MKPSKICRPFTTATLWIVLVSSANLNAADLQPSTSVTFTGKIVHVAVEGGFYGIQSTQGSKYLPISLPALLKYDGLTVQVQAEIAKEILGLQMWGQYIRLRNIAVIPCVPTTTP
ncbi:MAG: hypothetical protein BWK79_11410 [Beggiatoa sp. IS2]|nr:MAG: hypothetical protein BWK79_11410 [Beggiatoa sp. IS2]